MFSKAAAIATSALEDCDFEGAAYYRYMFFGPSQSLIEDSDTCKVVYGLNAIIGDLDNDMKLDQCEMSLMCIGSGAFGEIDAETAEEMSEDDWEEVAKGCIEGVSKGPKTIGWEEIEAMCEE